MSEQQPAASSQMPEWIPRLLVYVLLTAGAGIAIYNSIRALRGLITILLVALFVSFALEPAVNWLAAASILYRSPPARFCFAASTGVWMEGAGSTFFGAPFWQPMNMLRARIARRGFTCRYDEGAGCSLCPVR